MSHFSVLVIGDDVEGQLQPFHEYECTGIEDEYVQDVDITEEARAEYAASDKSESFVEFIESWYGLKPNVNGNEGKYGRVDLDASGEVVRVIDRTNPNKKWDWWSVGGRFTGLFSPDYDPAQDSANKEICFLCHGTGKRLDMVAENSCSGCQGTGVREKWPTRWKPHDGDQITAAQLRENLEALRLQAEQEAAQLYDKARPLIDDDFISWATMRERHSENVDTARTAYHAQAAVQRFRQADELTWQSPEDFLIPRDDEFLQQARLRAGRTFAVVKDGQWFEKGSMGWFGMVADEKPAEDWAAQYWAIVDSLTPETIVTVVDCHI